MRTFPNCNRSILEPAHEQVAPNINFANGGVVKLLRHRSGYHVSRHETSGKRTGSIRLDGSPIIFTLGVLLGILWIGLSHQQIPIILSVLLALCALGLMLSSIIMERPRSHCKAYRCLGALRRIGIRVGPESARNLNTGSIGPHHWSTSLRHLLNP